VIVLVEQVFESEYQQEGIGFLRDKNKSTGFGKARANPTSEGARGFFKKPTTFTIWGKHTKEFM
jgi:hypothetical protein